MCADALAPCTLPCNQQQFMIHVLTVQDKQCFVSFEVESQQPVSFQYWKWHITNKHDKIYCQTSNIRHTSSQNLKVSRLVLQLSLPNLLKPGVKVAEDDIAFKLAILNKSLHLNDNTCFFGIIQSSKLVLGSLLAKYNFFVQFLTKNFASSRMANCGSGLPAEWPFRSQNAIEASDSPLPGGLWVKRLITHALCSLA